MCFYEPYDTGFFLRIKLAPSAAACGFGGVFANADGKAYLKACVTTVPEKGKANKELIKMLAKELQVSKQSLEIVGGTTSHLKKIACSILLTPELEERLKKLVKES